MINISDIQMYKKMIDISVTAIPEFAIHPDIKSVNIHFTDDSADTYFQDKAATKLQSTLENQSEKTVTNSGRDYYTWHYNIRKNSILMKFSFSRSHDRMGRRKYSLRLNNPSPILYSFVEPLVPAYKISTIAFGFNVTPADLNKATVEYLCVLLQHTIFLKANNRYVNIKVAPSWQHDCVEAILTMSGKNQIKRMFNIYRFSDIAKLDPVDIFKNHLNFRLFDYRGVAEKYMETNGIRDFNSITQQQKHQVQGDLRYIYNKFFQHINGNGIQDAVNYLKVNYAWDGRRFKKHPLNNKFIGKLSGMTFIKSKPAPVVPFTLPKCQNDWPLF